MSLGLWIVLYSIASLIYKWILSWGGADFIKGWKNIFFFDVGNVEDWNREQIRFMALIVWSGLTILFIIGLFYPEFRYLKINKPT